MSPQNVPIYLGSERVSGGNLRATYSLKAGTRVHVWVLPEAYAAGALAGTRTSVAEWFRPLTGPTTTPPEA